MRRPIPLLALGLLFLWLAGSAGPVLPSPGGPARPEVPGEATVPGPGESPEPLPPPVAASAGAGPFDRAGAPPQEEAALRALLCSLRAAADASPAIFPAAEIDDLRALLMRRPDLADVLCGELPSLDPACRTLLLHTFHSLADPPLKNRLLAAFEAADEEGRRAAAVADDPRALLGVLGGDGDDRLRLDVLERLTGPALANPEVVDVLLRLAATETDEAVRGLAISRLGQSADPRALPALCSMLDDRAGAHSDRVAAARALAASDDARAARSLSALLAAGESTVLTRLAAAGLARHTSRPEVAAALLSLFSDDRADGAARTCAGSSLVEGVRHASAEDQPALVASILGRAEETIRRGAVADCALVTLAKLAAFFPGRYDREIAVLLTTCPEGARTAAARFPMLSPLAKGGE